MSSRLARFCVDDLAGRFQLHGDGREAVGQGVVELPGHTGPLLHSQDILCFFSRRNIPAEGDEPVPSAFLEPDEPNLGGKLRSILAAAQTIHHDQLAGRHRSPLSLHLLPADVGFKIPRIHPKQFISALAENGAGGVVDIYEPPVQTMHENCIGCKVQKASEQ